jgi:hypothetical protein
MSITKNVFIVNCERERFEKFFSKKRNSDVINWKDIRDKLTNNDALKIPPTKQIIEFQIIKKFNSFSKCKRMEFLYYYVDKVSDDIINEVKGFFRNCQFPVNYHVITSVDQEFDSILNDFNSVQLVEDDKK